jgi:hypothetical protein
MSNHRSRNGWWLVLAFASLGASAGECTKVQTIAAEAEAGTLRSWLALYRSFRSYAHCDDGAIGEGYSESVTLLLADRWKSFPVLAKLVADDPEFEKFVLRHINGTVPKERIAKIVLNAKHSCPKAHKALCERIQREAHDG